jgi:murein DD-endopeptidase MepM/ murein hydrolase activator NlpD
VFRDPSPGRSRVPGLLRLATGAAVAAAVLTLVLPGLFGAVPVPRPEPISGEVRGAVASPVPGAVVMPVGAPPGRQTAARPDDRRLGARIPRREPLPPDQLTGYVWPIKVVRITLPFGPTPWGSRIVDGERFHDGIDVATFCGDRIMAAHDGYVLAAGRKVDHFMGWVGDLRPYLDRLEQKHLWPTLPNIVVVDDGNGYRSVYAHFGKVVVKAGQTVKAGQLLGYEGATGRASGCHLHYGLFSPTETRRQAIAPDTVKRMKVPTFQVARIDPALVLPPPPQPKPKASPAPSAPPTAADTAP